MKFSIEPRQSHSSCEERHSKRQQETKRQPNRWLVGKPLDNSSSDSKTIIVMMITIPTLPIVGISELNMFSYGDHGMVHSEV